MLFWPDYSACAIQCNAQRGCMRPQHEVVLYVDARQVWLTRQEIPGIRSQNCNAKLTRLFLSCEGAGPRDQHTDTNFILRILIAIKVCLWSATCVCGICTLRPLLRGVKDWVQ